MSRRDDATIRAGMREDMRALSRALMTLADYEALPGVAGVEDRGEKRIVLYREHDLPVSARAGLQAFVDERKPLNVLVTWKADRRQAERRRRLAEKPTLPPIPSDARWA